jgi:hypothetical protein
MLLVDIFRQSSVYSDSLASRLLSSNGKKNGILFQVKSYIVIHPFKFLIILFLILNFVFAFIITVLEKEVGENVGESYYEAIWMIVVMVTTVGYGDSAPNTQFARLAGTLACIFGVALLSLVV